MEMETGSSVADLHSDGAQERVPFQSEDARGRGIPHRRGCSQSGRLGSRVDERVRFVSGVLTSTSIAKEPVKFGLRRLGASPASLERSYWDISLNMLPA
jgi:hypothetical protein